MSENGMSAVPQDDRIPVQVSDTVVRGTDHPDVSGRAVSTHTDRW